MSLFLTFASWNASNYNKTHDKIEYMNLFPFSFCIPTKESIPVLIFSIYLNRRI